MKTMVKTFAIGLAGILIMGAPSARAVLEVSASFQINAEADFFTPLAAQGAWIEVGSYGRCWQPAGVAVDWQPYCYGHWVWTDCGWYWETDEPWGWACYHYGRWVHHPERGWIWAPGVEWAPAWVTWRSGGGYIGWAPMAPRVGFFVSAPVAPFFFVEAGRFHENHRPSTLIVNNTTIINRTTVINTSVRTESRTFADGGSRKVMVNNGPAVADVEKASGKKFKPVAIQEAAQRARVPATMERKPAESRGKPAAPAPRETQREDRAAPGPKVAPFHEAQPERRQAEPAPKPEPPPNHQDVGPAPEHPQGPGAVPDNPNPPGRGKGRPDDHGDRKGKGRGRDNQQ